MIIIKAIKIIEADIMLVLAGAAPVKTMIVITRILGVAAHVTTRAITIAVINTVIPPTISASGPRMAAKTVFQSQS